VPRRKAIGECDRTSSINSHGLVRNGTDAPFNRRLYVHPQPGGVAMASNPAEQWNRAIAQESSAPTTAWTRTMRRLTDVMTEDATISLPALGVTEGRPLAPGRPLLSHNDISRYGDARVPERRRD
jgi:hypothetical protein